MMTSIPARQLLVRRWLTAVLGRESEEFAINPQATLEFLVPGMGAKLRINSPDRSRTFSIQFWSEADARALADWAEAAGAGLSGSCRSTGNGSSLTVA
jgi:hypothetical protein